MSDSAFSSNKQPPYRREVININCSDCFILKERLQLSHQELESAKTTISLLRDDNTLTSAPIVTDSLMLGVTSANMHDHNDMNWTPDRHKVHKKMKSSYNTAGNAEMSTMSSNHFSPLDNLKVNREDEVITLNNKVNLSTTSTMKNATCQQHGINKIRTIINGRVKNSDMQYPSKTKFKLLRAKPDKSIKCDHKVHIIGDSHLKGSVIKINQYLNTNFVVSSFIKPGAGIKQIVYSQEMEFNCLEKKGKTVVNGGTNDLDNNSEKRKSALVHMLQFAQKYVNTNIIMVNTPLRQDLAMDSQINLEIQDFSMKLSKSAKLFRHIELVEISFNRKYFTKQGLHLNNVGKEGLAKVIASQINKIINCRANENPVISPQWKDESNNKSIIVNTTHLSTPKTAVDNSPKLVSLNSDS